MEHYSTTDIREAMQIHVGIFRAGDMPRCFDLCYEKQALSRKQHVVYTREGENWNMWCGWQIL